MNVRYYCSLASFAFSRDSDIIYIWVMFLFAKLKPGSVKTCLEYLRCGTIQGRGCK